LSRRAARTDPGGHAVAIHFGGGRGESRAGGVASGPRGCVSCEVRSAAKRQLVRRVRRGGRVSWSRSCCARFGAQPIVRGRVGCARAGRARPSGSRQRRGSRWRARGSSWLKVSVVGWESRYKGSGGSSSFSLSGARPRAGSVLQAGGRSGPRRRRGGRRHRSGQGPRWDVVMVGVRVLAAVAVGVFVWRSLAQSDGSRRGRGALRGRRGCVVTARRCGGR
jgi:hypothetical protein